VIESPEGNGCTSVSWELALNAIWLIVLPPQIDEAYRPTVVGDVVAGTFILIVTEASTNALPVGTTNKGTHDEPEFS
jgi:hypothetical protein